MNQPLVFMLFFFVISQIDLRPISVNLVKTINLLIVITDDIYEPFYSFATGNRSLVVRFPLVIHSLSFVFTCYPAFD